jgi:hypothetical protein
LTLLSLWFLVMRRTVEPRRPTAGLLKLADVRADRCSHASSTYARAINRASSERTDPMSVAPPGWNPDSNPTPGAIRPEDGSRWAEHGHQVVPAPQFAEAGAGSAETVTRFAAYDPPAAAAGFSQFAAAPVAQPTVIQRNSTTFTAILVVALYLVLATTTGIVLIGIFPAMLAFRALQRREPLALIAVASAAVAIVFSFSVLAGH